MESPSAQDRPRVDAQEDSSSVDENQTLDATRTSWQPNANGAAGATIVKAEDSSSSLEIVSRLSSDEPSDPKSSPEVFRPSERASESPRHLESFPEPPENPGIPLIANPPGESSDNDPRNFDDDFLASVESTPSRKRPAPEFLPINAEIKRIGVEISEEHAKQVKNDIRRLSPVLVSLRERTLGEISLTSDSGRFDDDDQAIRIEIKDENDEEEEEEDEEEEEKKVKEEKKAEESLESSSSAFETSCPVSTNFPPPNDDFSKRESEANPSISGKKTSDVESSVSLEVTSELNTADSGESRLLHGDVKDPETPVRPSRHVRDAVDNKIQNSPTSSAVSSPNDRLQGHRELVIVLSRVDDGGAETKVAGSASDENAENARTESAARILVEENGSLVCEAEANEENVTTRNIGRLGVDAEEIAAAETATETATAAAKIKTEAEDDKEDEECSRKNGLVLVGDFRLSPKYLKNDQLTRKSAKVVIERTLESPAVGSSPLKSPNVTSDERTTRGNLDVVRRSLAESLIASNDEETEDATVSDISTLEEDSRRPESPDVVAGASSDLQESVDTETETETGSDSSELNSMTSIRLVDCREAPNGAECPETDSVVSDEVPGEMMTRLESERPEAFTEDSAESLALATGARDEVRSDGSDSGLGSEIPGDPGPAPAPESDSETSFLDKIPDDILSDKEKAVNPLEAFVSDAGTSGTQPQQPQQHQHQHQQPEQPEQQQQQIPLPSFPSPPKSSLKRRLTDCMEGEPSPKRINTEDPMRKKRNIQFDAVTVYYFPRSQGFTCVPSQGGSTLGMSATHTHAERFSLAEHATEQRRIHRARLAQLRSERAANCVTEAASSSEDPSDDTDEEPSDTEELDIDSYYFLQPVPTWQRRALLRAAGVRRIDAVEKDECRDIRASREHCGCGCKGYCDPESCPCSRANVKCQVDRAGFPCGCSRDGCANSSGRIEFNPVRVRTHFIHTLMRLQLEKKQRDEDRTDHEQLLVNSQTGRGPMREVPVMMTGSLGPMEHPNVITGDPVACINAGGFTTLHYDSHEATATSCQPIVHGGREDSLDLYAIRDDCYPPENEGVGVIDATQTTQRKLHPEFGQAFQAFPGQQPGVSFPQGAYQDYQGYQNLASTSRSQFQPQFQALPAGNSGFSHYAYGQDPSVMQAACQPHPAPQHHHAVYEAPFPQEDPSGSQQQYTNLNSVQPMNAVVQQMGKLEPFSELLAGRYSYYGEVEPQPIGGYHGAGGAKIEPEKSANVGPETEETNGEDCDENFGEIIKKSMVETVSA